ncbi:hypothetical protein MSAN_01189600 [Mycena sanguinolenta]|uniref:Uncharacterized protein n=1 Tax=Mycena sanguinolenta TaxID=230812 RepID=A0A8H6YM60_9AGAR|nr:hypothetical protein MSAN_01189600 [Mycena sanguinolenta]
MLNYGKNQGLLMIQHSSKADQATLACASKLFRDLCLPILYRFVALKNSRAITSFCSGIIENPSQADAVRYFALDVPYDTHGIRCDLILASLKLMLKLDHLSLSAFTLDPRHAALLLEETHLPQLISCDIWVPADFEDLFQNISKTSDLAAVFLTRHSTIKQLYLHSVFRLGASRPGHVSLPNLEFYHGDAVFFLAIDAISLTGVQLTWSAADDIDKIIIKLSSMTKPDLPFVSCHRYRGDPRQIVTSVSKHMRHTQTLRLQSLRNSSMLLSQQTLLGHISECLPRFTNLVYLAIDGAGVSPTDGERIAVENWGEACPTLQACCLNYQAWEKVDGRWEEYPLKEFWVLAGLPATYF